jgi:hypothetical protein
LRFHCVFVQADGRIVASGSGDTNYGANRKQDGGNTPFVLSRFMPDGSTDLSFGGDGSGSARGYQTAILGVDDMALAPDGSIVLIGGDQGTVVQSFDAAGLLTRTGHFVDGVESDLAVTRDGAVYFAAQAGMPHCETHIGRLTRTGEIAPDRTFGRGGVLTLFIPSDFDGCESDVVGMQGMPDGSLLFLERRW